MAAASLRHEERLGLAIALAAHAALVAWLVLKPPLPAPVLPPERTEVTLTDDAGLTATAPEPAAAPAPQVAPELGPVEPAPPPVPVQRIVPLPPKPAPVAPSITPRPVPKAAPPAARAVPPAATRRIIPPRGTRIGNDFLKGVNATAPGTAKTQTAATIGPQVRASLAGAVLRQVRPNWQGRVPQGVNTDKLVTILSIELNPDGSLARRPTMIGQEGVDDSNRPQAQRHAEEAIKAVQLSAPFHLPPDLYEAWKKLPPLRFRKST